MGKTCGKIDLGKIKVNEDAVFPVDSGEAVLTGDHAERWKAVFAPVLTVSSGHYADGGIQVKENRSDLVFVRKKLVRNFNDGNISYPVKAAGQAGAVDTGKIPLKDRTERDTFHSPR